MKVFDASAVLAILFDEPGAEQARRWLEEDDALISSVNQVEVLSKLLDRGLTTEQMATVAEELPLKVVALTQQQAHQAAVLRTTTRALGLSLGDRCCLALAQAHGAPVVTADLAWDALQGFDIQRVR